jgi:hypothetical protein
MLLENIVNLLVKVAPLADDITRLVISIALLLFIYRLN